jgi:glycosyltransferase involved in cell wall biosynthesis
MLVSVIIPTYNRPEKTVRAVESVLAQNYGHIDLVVVDDGSTDDTLDRIRGLDRRGVRLVTQNHQGVSAARNHGLSISRGQLVSFLDSDDYWLPGKLEAQVNLFQENPGAMICQTEELWVRRGLRLNPAAKHRKPAGEAFFRSLGLCLISPSAVMMRRELFEQVGTFDESLPACEDYDLWLRITARYPVYLIEDHLVVKTGGHGDQLSQTTVGLDQYRVRALEKIVGSGTLDQKQQQAAVAELIQKARIYGQGCLKRKREREGRRFLQLAEEYQRFWEGEPGLAGDGPAGGTEAGGWPGGEG